MDHTIKTSSKDMWLELANGQQVMLLGDDSMPRPPGISVSAPADNQPWRAVLWSGNLSQPDVRTCIGTVGVQQLPGKKGAAEFVLRAEPSLNGLPTLSAALLDGTSIPIYLWRGQRGRAEERKMRARPHGGKPDLTSAELSDCVAQGCQGKAIARCKQCGQSFCVAHGQAAPDGAHCSACLTQTLTAILSSGLRANRLREAIPALQAYAEGPNTLPDAQRLLGLARAQTGDLDGALAMLEPLVAGAHKDLAHPISQAYLRRAARKTSESDFLAAALDLAEALRFNPEQPQAKQALPILRQWQVVALIRAGRPGEAVQVWEDEFDRSPTNLALVHYLAILYYRLATELEAQPPPASAKEHPADIYWRKAIAHWATVMYSQRFWHNWQQERQRDAGLQIGEDDITSMRDGMRERFLRDFRDAVARYETAGRAADAARMQEFELLWLLELQTARLLRECAAEYRPPKWPNDIACGPIMLDRLAQLPAGRDLVSALRKAAPSFNDRMGQRLQRYLSPIARYHFMIDEHRLDTAIAELEKATTWPEAKKLLATALTLKGEELAQFERYEQSISTFERAKAAEADLRPQATIIGEICVKRSKEILNEDDSAYAAAAKILERGLAMANDNVDIRSNLGVMYTQQGRVENNADRFAESVHLLRLAIQYAPTDAQTRRVAGIASANWAASISESEPDKAISLLKESLSYQQDEVILGLLVHLLITRARTLADAKKRDQAIVAMREALQHSPDIEGKADDKAARSRLSAYQFNRAVELDNQNQSSKALELAHESYWYESDEASRNLVVFLLMKLKRFDEAVGVMREAIKREPYDSALKRRLATMLHNHGVELANQNRHDEGIRYLQQALQIENDPATRSQLSGIFTVRGVNFYKLDRYDAALEAFQQALAYEDDYDTHRFIAHTLANRAVAKYKAGDQWGARKDLQEAVRHDPNDTDLRDALRRIS